MFACGLKSELKLAFQSAQSCQGGDTVCIAKILLFLKASYLTLMADHAVQQTELKTQDCCDKPERHRESPLRGQPYGQKAPRTKTQIVGLIPFCYDQRSLPMYNYLNQYRARV